jgi:hypothetical protein
MRKSEKADEYKKPCRFPASISEKRQGSLFDIANSCYEPFNRIPVFAG